jgi:uncharacterized membrane protein
VTAAVLLVVVGPDSAEISLVDASVLVLLAYLVAYLAITIGAFVTAEEARIRAWAQRDSRGTFLQRYVFGTAPGPGVSIFIGAGALAVAVVWLPGHGGTTLPQGVRIGVAVALVVVAWVSVAVSFAVAFHADNLVEDERALQFTGEDAASWADYVYFAVSVMTTFGTTDVTVASRGMRRTVTANAVIAFVFNTVTVATLVSALTA